MKKSILSTNAPAAIGPYSQAIETGCAIYVSGQLPIETKTGCIGDTVEEQTKLSLTNIRFILNTVGLDLSNVVKTTVFMTNLSDFELMNNVYKSFFTVPFPARSTIQVVKLPHNASVEIECIVEK